ncbi:glucosamine-6-phosphate deaminase [Clostridiaceae bacterium]|nr:glucosamine-6-phosphate deaminase [Clostridiaceae bacterium]RKI18357.1 glucosamine-6-phosphate deaminase [bacterium 1XD21-70]
MERELDFGKVNLKVYGTRGEMGKAAAKEAAECMRRMLKEQDEIHCVFAAAPSQNEFLEALIQEGGIDWSRVNGYHMDEYVGLGIGHPSSFNRFLSQAVFDCVPFKNVYLINGANESGQEAERYASILERIAIDITFMGIGENGHIAFNDPDVADFHDAKTVKVVELDEVCRMQQVHDGCFLSLEEVPKKALTVTVPKLVSAREIFCIVPTKKKQKAVREALTGEVRETCPASILRETDNVHMYIDQDCYWE